MEMLDDFRARILERKPLRLKGGGSKDFYGGPLAGEVLDTRSYSGIVSYEPTELVVTARCGTAPVPRLRAAVLRHSHRRRRRCGGPLGSAPGGGW